MQIDPSALGHRLLPDGRLVVVYPMMFGNARLCVGDAESYTYDDGYCYEGAALALAAMQAWDGTGDPDGWHRHIGSGRRRPDGDASREYVMV